MRYLSSHRLTYIFMSMFTLHCCSRPAHADIVAVNVSRDAYNADANFSVTVDHKQVFTNLVATASHAEGSTQAFTFTGNWGPGPHTITIRFLRDAYDKAPNLNRKLYIDNISYNGIVYKENVAELYNHAVDFSIMVADRPAALEPGVNLSGMEISTQDIPGIPGTNYTVPTLAELVYYHSKGLNVVRLPVLWERLQQGLTSASTPAIDPTYLGFVKTVLTEAGSLGMGVFVDIHDYGSYNGNKIGGGIITIDQFAAFWKLLATQLHNTSGLLGYDLMNEPNAMPSAAVWPAAAQAAVYAIRSVDMNTLIAIEGDNWSAANAWAYSNGNLNIIDPSSRLIYEAHVYGDHDTSGSHYIWTQEVAQGVTVNTIAQRVAIFGAWCRNNSYLCMVGEIGVGNDNPAWNVELKNGLLQMKADGLISVSYWAGGQSWRDYPMTLEPTNGVDAPQMAVMASFANKNNSKSQ